jgi:hypothetical protein
MLTELREDDALGLYRQQLRQETEAFFLLPGGLDLALTS